MARIRTIKPEFFTSEDIVSLSPLARLFYVSLWCESDREGRFEWKPKTFKLRYLPGDECDIAELAKELTGAGLVEIYEAEGKTYAQIPSFTKHQVINNRESESSIPSPTSDASTTRKPRVKAEGKEGREGKEGKEGNGKEGRGEERATRLPSDLVLPDDWISFCQTERPDLDPAKVFDKFRDHWVSKAGKDGAKLNWFATWRNWVREERKQFASAKQAPKTTGKHAGFSQLDYREGIEEDGTLA
jgi:hypothetical protein